MMKKIYSNIIILCFYPMYIIYNKILKIWNVVERETIILYSGKSRLPMCNILTSYMFQQWNINCFIFTVLVFVFSLIKLQLEIRLNKNK